MYKPSTRQIAYYIGKDGTYSRKANITVPQTAIDSQVLGSNFSISKPFDGEGGATFDGSHWQGSLNNCLISKQTWTTAQLDELFALTSEDFPSLSFYSDIYAWVKMGEDIFPAVTDTKGGLSNGALIGGSPGDFKDIAL